MSRADDLITLQAIARDRLGLVFPGTRLATFHGGVERAADEISTGSSDEEDLDDDELLRRFVTKLEQNDPRAHEAFAREITIGETYFFRDEKHFEVVRDAARRAFQSGDALTIWSAGCASGEEAYSLAIAALEAVPEIAPRLRVIGTDVSDRVIERARRAVYRSWSFRGVSPLLVQAWFERAPPAPAEPPGTVLLGPIERVRACVRFERANLLAGTGAPRDADIVFCRNVLIYFDPPAIEKATHVLAGALRRGGSLVTGPSDPLLASPILAADRERGFITYVRAPALDPRRSERSTPSLSPARLAPRAHGTSRPPPSARPRSEATTPARSLPVSDRLDEAKDLAARGELDRAKAILDELKSPAAEALVLRSVVLMGLGDHPGAIDAARDAVTRAPDAAEALAVLALALHAAGDHTAAREAVASASACLDELPRATKLVAHQSVATLATVIHGLSTELARSGPTMMRRRRGTTADQRRRT